MKQYINSIGSVEPEYLEQLRATQEQPGKYDYCINDQGDTVELAYEYGKDTIIVPKDKFNPEHYPEFHLGDKVERTDGTRTGIIYRSSCMSPKRHSHPQINLPTNIPINDKNPIT